MKHLIFDPPKPRTYFEQVPLDVVKKVAVRDLLKRPKVGPRPVTREPASRKTEPYSVGAHRLSLT